MKLYLPDCLSILSWSFFRWDLSRDNQGTFLLQKLSLKASSEQIIIDNSLPWLHVRFLIVIITDRQIFSFNSNINVIIHYRHGFIITFISSGLRKGCHTFRNVLGFFLLYFFLNLNCITMDNSPILYKGCHKFRNGFGFFLLFLLIIIFFLNC